MIMVTQRGMILLAVLLFLQIIAMLCLYSAESNLWESRMVMRYWQRYKLSEVADYLLNHIEKEAAMASPICTVPVMASETLIKQPFNWWQSVSCAGNFQGFQYYYVAEALGVDSCAYVDNQVAEYWRVSLLVTPATTQTRIILQSVIAKASMAEKTCTAPHNVSPGRQSWHELI